MEEDVCVFATGISRKLIQELSPADQIEFPEDDWRKFCNCNLTKIVISVRSAHYVERLNLMSLCCLMLG